MFEECGLDVYQSRIAVIEPVEENPLQAEAEQHRLQFYAAQERQRERWFRLENDFHQNGNAGPMQNLIAQMNAI